MAFPCNIFNGRVQFRITPTTTERYSVGEVDPCNDSALQLQNAEIGVNTADGAAQINLGSTIFYIPVLNPSAGDDTKPVVWDNAAQKFTFGAAAATSLSSVLLVGNQTGARDIIWDKTGTATGPTDQAGSQKVLLRSSMWTGAAEAERDWEMKAVAKTIQGDNHLVFTYNSVDRASIQHDESINLTVFAVGDPSFTQGYVYNDNNGNAIFKHPTGNQLNITPGNASTIEINAPTAGRALVFKTQNTEGLRIDINQRVGIGNPVGVNSALVVNGDIEADYLKTDSNQFLAHEMIRHTVTAGEVSGGTFTESWSKAVQTKTWIAIRNYVQNSSSDLKKFDPSQQDYDGSTITVNGIGALAANDVVNIYIVYEK